MAGDWLKMRTNLWDDPRVGRISDLTDSSEAMVIGALYWLWTAADEHTEDGFMPGLSLRQIDRKTGLAGFGAALCDVGWLIDSPEGVTIARFEEHNGASAKRRCAEAQRKANGRNVSASDADKERTEGGQDAPKSGQDAELEKRREESSSLRSEEGARHLPTRKRSKTAYPEGFAVSERVEAWAAGKGFDRLTEHLEAFERKAKAKGYTYLDWDLAFMEAIREDWAKLRGKAPNGAAPPPEHQPSDAAEKTAEYLRSQQLTEEQKAANAERARQARANLRNVA